MTLYDFRNDICHTFVILNKITMKTPIEKEAVLEYLRLERKQLLSKVEAIDNALIGLGGTVSNGTRQAARITTDINDANSYKDSFTWKEKIVYALNKIGAGTVQDIVKVLEEVDNTPNLTRPVTVNTSALQIKGFLAGDDSRPRKYSLKSPATQG